jgi:16S rRNA (cytidine1402-2'-O)-methyltransferase
MEKGRLLLIPTPIGNMGDWSDRARQMVAEADWVAAEDTRRTGQLLAHFGIRKRLVALHEHNEDMRAREVVNSCLAGDTVALMSDAGTPLISDPGFVTVRLAHKEGVRVVPVPGPCSAIVALSASGLPSDRFAFEGFLPAKKGPREAKLQMLRREPRTLIFFESTHRIEATLQALAEIFGPDRMLCIGKELTKTFETIWLGVASEALSWLHEDPARSLGEFVLVVEGCREVGQQMLMEPEHLLRHLLSALPPSKAAQLVAELGGGKKRDLYQLALTISGRDGG